MKNIKNHHRRVSYAASAGSARLIDDADEARELLKKFQNIGVREDLLANDIIDISPELFPTVVVDPCLLIKDYSEIEINCRVPSYKYILSYVVGSGVTLEHFNDYIGKLKNIMNIPVVHIGSKGIDNADINILDLAPGEWISFIKNADFVGTNSFHGTAFSINFEKQFLFFPHYLPNLKSRQMTLLRSLGLMDRFVEDIISLTHDRIGLVDYSIVSPKLEVLVAESRDFLLKSLDS